MSGICLRIRIRSLNMYETLTSMNELGLAIFARLPENFIPLEYCSTTVAIVRIDHIL